MKKQEFMDGIRDGFPICLGYFPVSMAFGLTAVLSGLPLWSVVLMSMTNLTSAGQVAGAALLSTGGALLELAMTTLIINMRYFLMSLSVSQKVDSGMTLGQRLVVSFGITDEIFAVSMQRPRSLTVYYMLGLILTPLIGWTSGTLVGAVATSFMPELLSRAMGIAIYGMFIAIVIPPSRKERAVLFTVVLAIVCSVAFACLPVLRELSGGWVIILITVFVSAVAAKLFPISTEEAAA